MTPEDEALCRQVSDAFWSLKCETELIETRKTLSAPLKAVLQSTLRDAQRIEARLEQAVHPRKAKATNGQ